MSQYIVIICQFIYMPQRKNDQHWEGHTAFLARTGKVTCPVAVTERLIKLLPQSSSAFPLVRRIVKSKSKEYFHCSLGVSVSTLREEFKEHIKPFVSDISKYGTHSMKSGALSNPNQFIAPMMITCLSNLQIGQL